MYKSRWGMIIWFKIDNFIFLRYAVWIEFRIPVYNNYFLISGQFFQSKKIDLVADKRCSGLKKVTADINVNGHRNGLKETR